MTDRADLPLTGIRVLDYSQFVAGPLATTLLGDLGADVIKIEAPNGDSYREYEPLGNKRSRRFFALNRGKRSIVLDLTDSEDIATSEALIATADVVVHNMPAERAERFHLSREQIQGINPRTVVSIISAFGTQGPLAANTGYDLIAQAYSGLLFADPRPGQDVPRRCGSIPLADITTGLLTVISVLTGLLGRTDGQNSSHFNISLLSSALLTQIQDLVRIDRDDVMPPAATGDLLRARGAAKERADALEPYYGCYETADGFIAVACLNADQRIRMSQALELTDPWVQNPQAPPVDESEFTARAAVKHDVTAKIAAQDSDHWVTAFRETQVPCAKVQTVENAFADEQVAANHLLQRTTQPGVGQVELFGSFLEMDGAPLPLAPRPAPDLGEHGDEIRTTLRTSAPKWISL